MRQSPRQLLLTLLAFVFGAACSPDRTLAPDPESPLGAPARSLTVAGAWRNVASLPMPRSGAALAAVGTKLHVIGGQDANSPQGWRKLNAHDVFDVSSETWAARAPVPTARTAAGSNAAVVGDRIYFIGDNPPGYCTNVVEIYTPATNGWTSGRAMPTERCHLVVLAVNGLIYAIGGTNTSGSIDYRNVEIYNPLTDTWTTGAPMPTGRQGMAAAVDGSNIYVLGGGNAAVHAASTRLDAVEVYNTSTNTWSTKARLPRARSSAGAAFANGLLYVIGGYDGASLLSTVDVFDPATNEWVIGPPLPAPRHSFNALQYGGVIYAVGGHDGREYLSSVVSLSPEPSDPPIIPPSANGATITFASGTSDVNGRDPNTMITGLGPAYKIAARLAWPQPSVGTSWVSRYPWGRDDGALGGGVATFKVQIPSNASVSSATLFVSIDNSGSVTLNGVHVRNIPHFDPITPVPLTPETFTDGENTFAIGFDNWGGPEGLYYRGSVTYACDPGYELSNGVCIHTNRPPAANAGPDQELFRTSAAGVSVTLNGSASTDTDGMIASYAWSLNGNALGSGATLTRSFALGTHDVKLTVTDNDGATAEDFVRIAVQNSPPFVVSVSAQPVKEGSSGQLSAFAMDDDGTSFTFMWHFDDGTPPQAGQQVTRVYSDNGIFASTVTVTDADGATASRTVTADVFNVAPAVHPFAGATLITGEAYQRSGDFIDPGADSWIAHVSYGDGSAEQLLLNGKQFTMNHRYATAGTYQVVVNVRDDDGGGGVAAASVLVQSPADAVEVLQITVLAMGTSGQIPWTEVTPLRNRLTVLQNLIVNGNTTAARAELSAIVKRIQLLVLMGRASPAAGQTLVTELNRILAAL